MFKQIIINLQHAHQFGVIPQELDDNEASKITVIDVMEYIPFNDIPVVIEALVKKLAHNGELLLVFNSIDNVVTTLNNSDINIATINQIIFGQTVINNTTIHKVSALTVDYIKEILLKLGLTNILINFDGIKVKINGTRP